MVDDLCLTCKLGECQSEDSPCEKPLLCSCGFCQALEEMAAYRADDQMEEYYDF